MSIFYKFGSKFVNISHFIKKVIWMIFYTNLFNIFHLHVQEIAVSMYLLFKYQWKQIKTLLMLILTMKNMSRLLCILYKNYILLHNHSKYHYKSFHFHQFLCYIVRLIYQFFSTFTIFITYIFSNITWFITLTFTITRIPNKSFITYTFFNYFFTFTSTSTLFSITNMWI